MKEETGQGETGKSQFTFTPREIVIIQGLADGLSRDEIGRKLGEGIRERSVSYEALSMAERICGHIEASAVCKTVVEAYRQGRVTANNLPSDPDPALSEVEFMTLAMTAEGCKSGEVARKIGESPSYLLVHRKSIIRKLGVGTLYRVALWYADKLKQRGLL
ncbi:MAG: hypothetical protein A2735_02555 [Candidatus Yanofskybacteria bacterium RIFCSPHIGHO2_01_FULL_41_21]|uniref:Uncharacterized protein n=1 Tax=Candidatus Yanofskybacteria bacterium RIFCSPHIGHO2_01_FULL_41_21 TaxID=1802660 RepID=A0A1F8EC60_9BACT|nr:MAG: hypothetical protein A2735_02555 [Candidatus Yanofskybacteria bacterium RIFCSPHIGHO2_01_FULL_41_21]